jgi:uncharacterized protein YegL
MTDLAAERPAAAPLHVIWLVDSSGSMSVDGKMQELGFAIREALPELQRAARDNPAADVLVSAVRFSDGAAWHAPPTPVQEFRWIDPRPEGVTDMGQALSLIARRLDVPPMPERAFPPFLVLISDGRPTDDFAAGLHALTSTPWGARAVRVAVAIGDDADHEVLQQFAGRSDLRPLRGDNPEALVAAIRWVTAEVERSATLGPTAGQGLGTAQTPGVPIPVAQAGPLTAEDVW